MNILLWGPLVCTTSPKVKQRRSEESEILLEDTPLSLSNLS